MLEVQIVPYQNWKEVLNIFRYTEFNRIKKDCFKSSGYICSECGENGIDQGFEHKVECVLIWKFDDNRKIQKLINVKCLCPKCAGAVNSYHPFNIPRDIIEQIRKVNYSKHPEETGNLLAINMIKQACKNFLNRSEEEYTIDIEWIKSMKG